VARTLAETGLAPLYAGILRMMARQQDRPNVVRIRGEWISIDPRALATMWETSINVGGKGMPHERLAMLNAIAQKQEQILGTQGLNNPLVGVEEYRNTLTRMLETVSISDTSSYFKSLPPGWQPPPQEPQPDPNQILAAVEQQKTAAGLETDRAKAQTDRAKLLLEDDRERDKSALDAWAKTWVAAAQFGTPAPSFDEFQAAMKSKAPAVGLLADLPPPMSPQQPATGQPQQPPKPAGAPPPMQPQLAGPRPPMMPQQAPRPAPSTSLDPATAMAVRGALAGKGMPSAYGNITNNAMLSAIAGPGGPPLPKPGGA